MNELFDAANSNPKLDKAASTSKLDNAKTNSRSSSQNNIANGIYKTISPRRSQSKPEMPMTGLFDNPFELHNSCSDHMLISPLNTVDKLNSGNEFCKKFYVHEDAVVCEDANENITLSNDEKEEDDVLVDILPSFQFYDSLVKFLPDDSYNDNASFQYSSSDHNIPITESETLNSDSNPPGYLPTSEGSAIREMRSWSTLSAGPYVSFSERYEVDKFYELPKRKLNSLDIKIVLTRDPVEPNVISEKEKLLKEFSSGELINGYVTVENKSSLPIKFEGFYVSFEGVTTLRNKTEKKTYTKRFLKAHDLSATWSYGQVELASGVNYDTTVVDASDNTKLGLPNSKILKPQTKYKKYFCFKVPKEILDCNCQHQIPQHLALPPSYGLDRNEYENSFIRLNSILGYGHTGLKGSPLLTADLASYDKYVLPVLKQNLKVSKFSNKLNQGFNYEGSNISYSVNCKLIMKDKGTSMPYVLNNTSYSIRVIPNTLSSNRKYNYNYGKSSLVDPNDVKTTLLSINEKAIKKLNDMEELLLKLEHWDESSTFMKEDLTNHLQNCKKQKNTEKKLSFSLPTENKDLEISSLPPYIDPILKKKDELKTVSSHNTVVKKSLATSFNKFNNLLGSSTPIVAASSIDKTLADSTNCNNNKFSIEAKFNKDLQALPYQRSFCISTYNEIKNKSKMDRRLWEKEVFQQLPVLPKDYELSSLPCTITATNNSGKLPTLKKAKASLCSYTVYSSKINPIVLDANFLMTEEKVLEQIISNFKRYSKEVDRLKNLYIKFQAKLQSLATFWNVDENLVKFDSFIPKDLVNDLQAIASLNIERFEMKNIFTPTVLNSSSSKWKKISENKSIINFDLNLSYMDRLLLTILPSFDSCLISRFYHLQVECKLSNEETVVLKIPIDVKHFK